MPYRLHSPLTAAEADTLSTDHAFRRICEEDSIWAEFDSRHALELAKTALGALRMRVWREQSVVDAEKTA